MERLVAALTRRSTDRPCCLPLVFAYAARQAGIKVRDYVGDGEALARAQLSTWRQVGYDALFVYADSMVEAESLGVELRYPADDYPYIIQKYEGKLDADFWGQTLPDPARQGRMPQLLKAVRIIRQEVGKSVPVVGCVTGPISIAAQLLGLEQMLFLLVDNPEGLRRLFNHIAELVRSFGLALLAAGASVIMVIDPAASQNIIPATVFRDYELPLLKSIFIACKKAGALACWLMITGESRGLLASYPLSGADLVTVDYIVPLDDALALLPHLIVTGNIKPLNFVACTPAEIEEEAKDLLAISQAHARYIPGTGCELPLNSKPENLAAFVKTLTSIVS